MLYRHLLYRTAAGILDCTNTGIVSVSASLYTHLRLLFFLSFSANVTHLSPSFTSFSPSLPILLTYLLPLLLSLLPCQFYSLISFLHSLRLFGGSAGGTAFLLCAITASVSAFPGSSGTAVKRSSLNLSFRIDIWDIYIDIEAFLRLRYICTLKLRTAHLSRFWSTVLSLCYELSRRTCITSQCMLCF